MAHGSPIGASDKRVLLEKYHVFVLLFTQGSIKSEVSKPYDQGMHVSINDFVLVAQYSKRNQGP